MKGKSLASDALAAPKNADSIRCLADLRLSEEDLRRLAEQGFVTSEWRGSNGPYFKLRFRVGAKQIVRYLGSDPESARAIVQELNIIQAAYRHGQLLRALVRQARAKLRQAKQTLEPLLHERGYHFHGRAIRTIRARAIDHDISTVDLSNWTAPLFKLGNVSFKLGKIRRRKP